MVFGPKQVDLEHRSEFQDLRSKQQDSAHLLTKSGPEEVFQEICTFWSIWICLCKSVVLICALSCDAHVSVSMHIDGSHVAIPAVVWLLCDARMRTLYVLARVE